MIQRIQKQLVALLFMLLLSTVVHEHAHASDALHLQSNLDDYVETRSELLTFDVWAYIEEQKAFDDNVTVTNNGKSVPINWSDLVKTSYTVTLSPGVNALTIRLTDGIESVQQHVTIMYEPAAIGEIIGEYTFSMDAFVAGMGYLIPPKVLPIVNGDNAAHHVKRALEEDNFTFNHTGDLNNNFYLGTVFGGNLAEKYNYTFPAAIVEAALVRDIELNYDFEPELGLGEFMLSGGSGWMYSVNNEFPNVGFADYYLQHGDVMRVQFTLNLGNDIGGGDSSGMQSTNFFDVVSKDALTAFVALVNDSPLHDTLVGEVAYSEALNILTTVNASQKAIDAAYVALEHAYIETFTKNIATSSYDLLKGDIARLTAVQRSRIANLAQLHETTAVIEQQIDALPPLSSITKAHFVMLQNIRQQYAALDDLQLLVSARSVEALAAAEAKAFDSMYNTKPYEAFQQLSIYDAQHVLTIMFTEPVDATSVNERAIVVRDAHYTIVPTQAVLNDDLQTIYVHAVTPYKKGSLYTLYVTEQLTSSAQRTLSQPVRQSFIMQ